MAGSSTAFWLPLLVGIALGLGSIGLMALAGVARERGSYAVAMVAIAVFYPVFAVGRGWDTFAFHAIVASLFIVLAILGARKSLWWIVAAMVLHGLFDILDGLRAPDPSPDWWGPFCLGVDLAIAAALSFLLMRDGSLRSRSASPVPSNQTTERQR